jgi:Domain of unknown function (DUF4352)
MASWRRGLASCALALAATATGCADEPGETDAEAGGPAPTTPATGETGVPGPAGAPPAGTDQPSLEIPTVGVGERVTAAGYELVVHEVTAPAPAPDPAAAPGPGNMLMSVDVELVNRTASERDATYLQTEVIDASGEHYEPSPYGQALARGWIAADTPLRVRQLYEVPIQATSLVLTLRPDLVSDVAATVRLR